MTAIPKIKKVSYKAAVKRLDKAFSLFIRARDGKKCITCGRTVEVVQCGHYISRKYLSTRWNEKNCASQCVACNIMKKGDAPTFAIEIMKRYGKGILVELDILKHSKTKFAVSDLLTLETYYRKNTPDKRCNGKKESF